MPRILVIEDDLETAEEISACLSASGFEATKRFDGPAGLEAAMAEPFDAITLDRMLPGLDGLAVIKALRDAGSEAPVLMISALSDVDDRVDGLRRHRTSGAEVRLRVADLELDLVKHEAIRDGRRIELLPMEFQLLEFMMRNAGQLLTRRMIFEKVWEYYFDPGTNLINVHVGKLRRKIDGPGLLPLIRTERGQGYMLYAP